MFGHDAKGTRFSSEEKRLGAGSAALLAESWRLPTEGVVSGTPVVSGGTVFAGDTLGNVYAVKADDGRLRWQNKFEGAAFTASATVTRGVVVIGDQAAGFIFGLDKGDGRLLWKIRPNTLGRPAIWGSGTIIDDNVAIGVASNDEGPPPPFRSRGSLVLLDPKNGDVIWQTFTVSDADYAAGSSGVSIWTSPVYDPSTGLIYAGTGNNFTEPPTANSDAIMAFDARTGRIRWSNQRFPNDVWTPRFPLGPDFDFGDSPQLYRLKNGRKVVGEGQKSGFYHVLDAATGETINQAQFLPGSVLGGLYTDSAVVGDMVIVDGNDLADFKCSVIAIDGDGSGQRWKFDTFGLTANGLAVANGVVFFKPSHDPNLYALDLYRGDQLAAVPVGGSNSGPSIAHGQVFLGLGNILTDGFQAPGAIVALGIDHGRHGR
jgi:polyvinyl alcohol dehydrogenase (cytochrome)